MVVLIKGLEVKLVVYSRKWPLYHRQNGASPEYHLTIGIHPNTTLNMEEFAEMPFSSFLVNQNNFVHFLPTLMTKLPLN